MVTVANESGTAFPNARLQLVAGDVNRVRSAERDNVMLERAMMKRRPLPPWPKKPFRTITRSKDVDQQPRDEAGDDAGGHLVSVEKRYVVNGQAFSTATRRTLAPA